MSEKIFTPEDLRRERQDREDAEELAGHFAIHPEELVHPVQLRECGPEVAEFEGMLDAFESHHSLSALHALTYLTFEESRAHPIREPARLALVPIVAKMNSIKNETNISPERYKEINAKYKRLARAVGNIDKNGKVDHDR